MSETDEGSDIFLIRTKEEPTIQFKSSPDPGTGSRSIESCADFLKSENLIDYPLLMVSGFYLSKNCIEAFEASFCWKLATQFKEIRNLTLGALSSAPIVLNSSSQVLWEGKSSGEWDLAGLDTITGETVSDTIHASLDSGISLMPEDYLYRPGYLFCSRTTNDVSVVSLIQVKDNAVIKPQANNDLLWTDLEIPPTGATELSTQILWSLFESDEPVDQVISEIF